MASLIDILLKEDKTKLENLIKDKVNIQIKNSIGVDDVEVFVDDIKISKFRQLIAKTLIDERGISEEEEINRNGRNESRTLSMGDVDLFSFDRNDYQFSNEGREKEFRVDKSTNTRNCPRCQGRRKNPCSMCHTRGEVRCDNCSNGQIDCGNCSHGFNPCWSCTNGWKTTGYGDDKRTVRCTSCVGGKKECGSCGGTGKKTCRRCNGTTMHECYTCKGAGYNPCRKCDAVGTFNDFFVVKSDIIVKSNAQFLDLNPDGEFVKSKISEDEFDYSKSFTDYKLSNLKEFNAELKTLTKGISIVKSKQDPIKVNFSINSCAALSFNIKIGSSTYIGGIKNGEIWYDDSFLQFLFYDIVDGVAIDPDFNKITNLKKPIVNQIEGFEDVFNHVEEFKKFEEIINFRYSLFKYFDSTGKKIISTRNIKLINTELFLSHLYKKFTFKFAIIALIWCVPFFIYTTKIFGFTFPDIPNGVALGGLFVSVIATRLIINKKSPNNAILKGLVILFIALGISYFLYYRQAIQNNPYFFNETKGPSALKKEYACKCLYEGSGFSELDDTPFDDLSYSNQRLRRKCSEIFIPWFNATINNTGDELPSSDEMDQQSLDAVDEAKYIVEHYGCGGENEAKNNKMQNSELNKNNYSNSKAKEFNYFKKKHKVVHKDFIFKGGHIDYQKGWDYTDSLIIVGQSFNVKKHYIVEAGSRYQNDEYGGDWYITREDIYINMDDDIYNSMKKNISWNSNQLYRCERQFIGTKIIVEAESIKHNKNWDGYGIYFIQNNTNSWEKYVENNNSKEEEFILNKNLNLLFNNESNNDYKSDENKESSKESIDKRQEKKKKLKQEQIRKEKEDKQYFTVEQTTYNLEENELNKKLISDIIKKFRKINYVKYIRIYKNTINAVKFKFTKKPKVKTLFGFKVKEMYKKMKAKNNTNFWVYIDSENSIIYFVPFITDELNQKISKNGYSYILNNNLGVIIELSELESLIH